MKVKSMASQNILDIQTSDKAAIRLLMTFPIEKQALVKGIILGLNMAYRTADKTTDAVQPYAPNSA